MLYRLMFGAAAASVCWMVWTTHHESVRHAAAYPVGEDGSAFDAIARVLQRESLRHGLDGRCTMAEGVALVLTSRRGHAEIATLLSHPPVRSGAFISA